MQKFTQKYTLVYAIEDLREGDIFLMEDWPLHVTLADVFAIQGDPKALLDELSRTLGNYPVAQARVIGDDWFGKDKRTHVMLIDKTSELQNLHETILSVLEKFSSTFNSPQFTKEGFRPHSTIKGDRRLNVNHTVTFDAVTLIDMFPDDNPFKRRVLGTIHFAHS
jgi:2'-5' RNA ligase